MKRFFTLFSTFVAVFTIIAISVNAQSQKKVLIEENTGAWCQFCPDGAVQVNNLMNLYPGLVYTTAIHNGDGMVNPSSSAIESAFPPTGFPAGMVDRVSWPGQSNVPVSRTQWGSYTVQRLLGTTPVNVSMNAVYDATTRLSTVTVTANFTGAASGNMKINLFYSENKVTGTGSGFNQSNAYNNSAGHPYYQAGNPIVGFEHDHVLRYTAGPVHGVTGIIPSTVTAGSTYSNTFTYTLPANFDESNMKIIGVIIGDDNSIMNVEEGNLSGFTSIKDEVNLSIGNLYPNPASNFVTVEYNLKNSSNVELKIYNALGQVVSTLKDKHEAAGNHTETFDLNLTKGMYFLNINTDQATFTRKLNIVTSE
ncbi:MAG: Omp28-related outer membrane protein [Bacteroidia bacterium]|nr:Omp28-related outer membrane protein [Bacteroidia bacterium]NNM15793.1 Omp28-related outer membrane protein [Bacteroidia bacterium]